MEECRRGGDSARLLAREPDLPSTRGREEEYAFVFHKSINSSNRVAWDHLLVMKGSAEFDLLDEYGKDSWVLWYAKGD
uniref:Uncharacterized protein n=1 Tax=Oryza glumipatula TaxID=40148 RepID=A0A0E0AGN1_9ORYZ